MELEYAGPLPSSLTITPLGRAFAKGEANQLFDRVEQCVGEQKFADCKAGVFPLLLDVTMANRASREEAAKTSKLLAEVQRQYTEARRLMASLADDGGMAKHRPVLLALTGAGFTGKALRTHVVEWVSKIEEAYMG